MSTHTIHLDEEAEQALVHITQTLELSIAEALKQGLLVLRAQVTSPTSRTPYDVYATLDLGEGGEAIAPSTDTQRGVHEAIRRKLGR